MPKHLRNLWLAWSAITLATLATTVLCAGLLAAWIEHQLGSPELRQTAQVIGTALASDVERALRQQIPLDQLVGVEPWFDDIVAANPVLQTLALTDASGRLLAGHGVSPELATLLAQRRAADNAATGALQLATLPLHGPSGAVIGWLHAGGTQPSLGAAPWLAALTAALLLALLASLSFRRMLLRRLEAPLAACRAASGAVAAGRLPLMRTVAVRDPASRLQAAFGARLQAARRDYDELQQKLGEVRAAHFDPAILQRLDRLQESLAPLQPEQPATDAVRRGPRRGWSLSGRLTLAALCALLVIGISLLTLQRLHRAADARELVAGAEQLLLQAWRATLEQDKVNLDADLDHLLATPGFTALLAGDNDLTLDQALTVAANPQLEFAVLRLDGAMRAASARQNDDARLNSALLEPLRNGETEIHGVWQNAIRTFQSGVARRVTPPGAAPMVVVAARPLESSLNDLAERLPADVAAADLRGQPLLEIDTAVVAAWRAHGRRGFLGSIEGSAEIVAATTLAAPSGYTLGTLLARLPAEGSMTPQEAVLALVAGAVALAAALGLLLYPAGLLAPLIGAARQLEDLAAGRPGAPEIADHASRETERLYLARRQLGEKIDMLQTLRRSRERQGRRQARFIRHQMQQLAARLDEAARLGILADLERIEQAGRTEAAQAAGDQPDRIVDEFGILALGFQNLVARIGDQYQELDRLVRELREALRAKTQFIALQQELEIARKMQLSILPREFPPHGGLEAHATMLPAKEVGGDFYDVFALDQHRVGLVVADVSGKGVPAAFFMAVARTLLRAVAQFSDRPGHCLAQLNDLLAADNEELMFVTLFYAIVDTRDGSVTYANAGHNPPCLLRADGGVEPVPTTGGIALAVAENMAFREGTLTLAPGDGLFLYTDGITEACAPDGTLFGDARLAEALRGIGTQPVRDIPASIIARIKEFEAGGAQADDITCLMARYRGGA